MSGQFEPELESLRAGGETNRNLLAVLLSFYPLSEGDLDLIAARMDAPLDTSGLSALPHADMVEANLPAVQVFHRALVDWRRSDVQALERHRLRLQTMRDTSPDHLLARSYERLLDALLLWNTGDIEGADRAFRESVVPVPIRLTTLLSFNLAINRFLHGRMLFEAGRYAEAIRWLSAVDDGFLRLSTGRRLFFPALYMRAQSHEQLGQTAEAIQLYTDFVRAWEEADPALQPMVEEARARLDALAMTSAREPAG
jgi:tetratricopeptide (TPR) repeat protein